MASGVSKVSTIKAVVYGYGFFFKNILQVLKLIFPFIFVYLLMETIIKTDATNAPTDIIFYIKNFMIDLALGWMLFGISRRVVLAEDVSKMKWAEIFDTKRMNALYNGALIFAACQAVSHFAENSASAVIAEQGFNKSTCITILLFLYVAVLMFIASFVAVPVSAQANVMSYLYVACRPKYLWTVLSIWSLTTFPILALYYGGIFFVTLGGKVDLATLDVLMQHSSFVDRILFGLTTGVGFILLSAAIAHTMSHFLVLRTKPSKIIEEMKGKAPQAAPQNSAPKAKS